MQSLKITVNGSPMELSSGITIAGLLDQLQVSAKMVAVEQNLEIVPKSEYDNREIAANDTIEIVHFVGGG